MAKKRVARKPKKKAGMKVGRLDPEFLENLPEQVARNILNDQMFMMMVTRIEQVAPGELISAVKEKFPRLPVNKSFFHYLKKEK